MSSQQHMADNEEILRIQRLIISDAWEHREYVVWWFVSAAHLGSRIGAWITKRRYGA